MNAKSIIAAAATLVLVGCSSTKVETRGEFFHLMSRNVISRDLTRPVSTDNEPVKYEYSKFPQETR